jgi:hypothetical protein
METSQLPLPQEDLAPKYQRDFFLTVIDPPGTPSSVITVNIDKHGEKKVTKQET